MNVPVLDLTRQYAAIKPEIDEAVQRVVGSGRFILGPEVQSFEAHAAAYCNAKHAIGLASGTDALLLSLRALAIGPGDRVIVPSFTFFATAGVVHNVGATPVFCDIDPTTFNLDPFHLPHVLASPARIREAERSSPQHVARGSWDVGKARPNSKNAIPPQATGHKRRAKSDHLRFRAVIPVHLYGQTADMDEIMQIADTHDLAVIEDAAQAIGAEYWGSTEHVERSLSHVGNMDGGAEDGICPQAASDKPQRSHEPQATGHKPVSRKAGGIGVFGAFSFYPTKNLGAYGDGGMVTTNDDALADKLRLLRVHGARPKYFHRLVGVNSRLDAIQAAILDVKLSHVDEWSEARRKLADRYDEALANLDGIVPPHRAADRTHIFHQYTIRVPEGRRDALREHLKEHGIGTTIYYPQPLHLQECFAHLGYRQGQLPHSEAASREALSLPIFPELTEAEQDYVVEGIKTFLGNA